MEIRERDGLVIRPIQDEEWSDTMSMVWRVFLRFETDYYSQEGIQNFRDFITDDTLYMMFRQGVYRVFGCFEGRKIVGMISVRSVNHISLLFVDEAWQHRGIASGLMRYLCDYLIEEEGQTHVTVNSSPYAIEFYHRMGFTDTDDVQESQGITFTPMKFIL